MDPMSPAASLLTEMPSPQFVMSPEGHRIATYSWGDSAAPDRALRARLRLELPRQLGEHRLGP